MRLAVIDGQGGGIGKNIITRFRREVGKETHILALGTNALATAAMLKAGATDGATGENAICYNVPRVDVVVGTVNIVCAHSMLGELTPAMAEAVAASPAKKLLLPLTRLNLEVMGVEEQPMPHYVDMLLQRLKAIIGGEQHV